MFEVGQYVEVACNGNYEVCRVKRIIGSTIVAHRADGFIWLGARHWVHAI